MNKNRIILRAVEPNDIDLIFKWENDQDLWHLSQTLIPFSRFDIEQYVMSADKDIFAVKQLRLIIHDTEENKSVGCIDIFDFDPKNRRAGLGILIEKSEQKKGYASEALDQVIEYSFDTLNLHQLYCNIEVDNTVSLELFRKKEFL